MREGDKRERERVRVHVNVCVCVCVRVGLAEENFFLLAILQSVRTDIIRILPQHQMTFLLPLNLFELLIFD